MLIVKIVTRLLLGLALLQSQAVPSTPQTPKAPSNSDTLVEPELRGKTDAEIVSMQADADEMLDQALEDIPVIRAKYAKVLLPDEFLEAVRIDVGRLQKETLLDPSYRADFNQLGDDMDRVSERIRWARLPRA